MSLLIQQSDIPDGIEIVLQGEFSASSTESFLSVVNQLPLESGEKVSLIMKQVSYIDSSGLGCLLYVQTQYLQKGIQVVLEEVSPVVRDLLERVNCLRLFQPGKTVPAPEEQLEAYTVVGDFLGKKTHMLTVLMATTSEIAGTYDETTLLKKIISEFSTLLSSQSVLLYLEPESGEEEAFQLWKEKAGEAVGAPQELDRVRMARIRQYDEQNGRAKLLKELSLLPEALAGYFRQTEDTRVILAPLDGASRTLGWIIIGASAKQEYLIQDNLKALGVFAKISGLLLENIRSGRSVKREASGIYEAFEDLARTRDEVLRTQKMASLGKGLLRLTRRLNNQLVPLLGYTQLILKTMPIPHQDRHHLLQIEQSVQAARRLLSGLMGVAMPPALIQAPTQLNDLCQTVVREFQSTPLAAGVNWNLELDSELPEVSADAHQSLQVFRQVLRNALEAIEGRPQGDLEIRSRRVEGFVEFEILDNGEGISQEFLEQVFEPLFTLRKRTENLGLGLALCRSILEMHQGEIRLESLLGLGTRVYLRWPLKGKEGSVAQPDTSEPSVQRLPFARVVVVDGDGQSAALMADLLAGENEVVVFHDGSSALRYLESHPFDLVLTELDVPQVSGARIHEWIKTRFPGKEKSLVFVTANAYDPEYRAFVESTGNLVIVKPFNIGTFRNLLYQVIQQQSA